MKFIPLCFLGVWVVCLSGCKSGPGGPPADTPTGGLELRMFVRDASGAESLYQVNRDGSIEFGGGVNARLDRTTWKGQLTLDEIQRLRSLIESHGWYERNPPSTGEPPDMLYRVTINSTQARKRFKVMGESSEVAPVRDVLFHAALRRVQPDLERLPQPSVLRPGAASSPAPATHPE